MQRTQELVCEAVIIVFFYFGTVLSHLPLRSLDTPSGPEQVNKLQLLFCWTQLRVEQVVFKNKSFWLLTYYSDVSHIMIDSSLSRHRAFLDYETS